MNTQQRAAMQMALEALESAPVQYDFNSYPMLVMTPDTLQTTLTALREALVEPDIEEMTLAQIAARHDQAEQEQFDMNDHPPHRLCECRKCMEYFTPLPDCDAFAAFGKPIAEQTNTQLMEGYRIGLAEMREKCAKVCKERSHRSDDMGAICAAAIRAIKFEGDTGFRPVSEMIAEHKQDPKKAAAIERAELRKQVAALKAVVDAWNNVEQEPVGVVETSNEWGVAGVVVAGTPVGTKLYTAPVRTKDLTDDELEECVHIADSECTEDACMPWFVEFARAVIAKFKEKNK